MNKKNSKWKYSLIGGSIGVVFALFLIWLSFKQLNLPATLVKILAIFFPYRLGEIIGKFLGYEDWGLIIPIFLTTIVFNFIIGFVFGTIIGKFIIKKNEK